MDSSVGDISLRTIISKRDTMSALLLRISLAAAVGIGMAIWQYYKFKNRSQESQHEPMYSYNGNESRTENITLCEICRCQIIKHQQTLKLPCGDVFHYNCIYDVLQAQGSCASCPYCRRNVPQHFLDKIRPSL